MTASLLGQFLAALHRRSTSSTGRSVLPNGRPPAGQLPAPRRSLLALPPPPGADRGPICPSCGYRHPPLRLAPTWSTPVDGTLDGRPRPLRHTAPAPIAHPNPWRYP